LSKNKETIQGKASEIWRITAKIAAKVFTAYSTTSRAEAERSLMIGATN
jgi:hypothetical protein